MTSVGVCETVLVSTVPNEIARFVGKRTVYRLEEIENLCQRHVLAILFRHARVLESPISIEDLKSHLVLKGPPQSITRLRNGGDEWLQSRLSV